MKIIINIIKSENEFMANIFLCPKRGAATVRAGAVIGENTVNVTLNDILHNSDRL